MNRQPRAFQSYAAHPTFADRERNETDLADRSDNWTQAALCSHHGRVCCRHDMVRFGRQYRESHRRKGILRLGRWRNDVTRQHNHQRLGTYRVSAYEQFISYDMRHLTIGAHQEKLTSEIDPIQTPRSVSKLHQCCVRTGSCLGSSTGRAHGRHTRLEMGVRRPNSTDLDLSRGHYCLGALRPRNPGEEGDVCGSDAIV